MKTSPILFSQIARLSALCAALVGFSLSCPGQGATVQITFDVHYDDQPSQPPKTQYTYQELFETGTRFWSPSGAGFSRAGVGLGPPDNGTAYLSGALPMSLSFNRMNGSPFGLTSVDLAGYSVVWEVVTADFVGHRVDGSTVAASFTPAGLTFETFYFSPEFNNLTHVDVLGFGSMDNLVLSLPVPEPATAALAALGLGFLGYRRMRRRNIQTDLFTNLN